MALRKVEEGVLKKQIASQLDINICTLCRWIKNFKLHGEAGIKGKKHPGNPRKVRDDVKNCIHNMLSLSPVKYGICKKSWNGASIQKLLKEKLNIEIHPKSIYSWLRRNGIGQELIRKWTKSS